MCQVCQLHVELGEHTNETAQKSPLRFVCILSAGLVPVKLSGNFRGMRCQPFDPALRSTSGLHCLALSADDVWQRLVSISAIHAGLNVPVHMLCTFHPPATVAQHPCSQQLTRHSAWCVRGHVAQSSGRGSSGLMGRLKQRLQ